MNELPSESTILAAYSAWCDAQTRLRNALMEHTRAEADAHLKSKELAEAILPATVAESVSNDIQESHFFARIGGRLFEVSPGYGVEDVTDRRKLPIGG